MASMKIAVAQLVLCAILGFTGIDGKPPSAVVGGLTANDAEFPYQVSLSTMGQHTCGGSIIDSTHVLTAAHCLEDIDLQLRFMTVCTGTNNIGVGSGQNYRIKKIDIHPGYSPFEEDSWRNDIAIITVARPMRFDRRTRPVELPTSDTPANTECTACGWGDTSYPSGSTPIGLRKVAMRVIPNSRCKLPGSGRIHDTHLCAYSRLGSGVCTGDSGGPLVSDGTIIGIASFVIPCGVGFPDVFTRVYKYIDWINAITGATSS